MGLIMSGWAKPKEADTGTLPVKYGAEYYREQFEKKRVAYAPIRMALVGKENTAKTGLALEIALSHTDKEIVIIDCDNSAQNTVDYLISDKGVGADRIRVIPMIDELDDAMWNEDNTTDWVAVVEKMEWFASFLGENNDDIGAVILDGGSTLLKWCEFVMTARLVNRGVINDGSENFPQKEWRERNRIFKGVINRLTALPIPYMFFTFHLKDDSTYVDIGGGAKSLMKIGEKVDWAKDTQRFVSQQIWLTRVTKKGDKAAGIMADKSLADGEFVIRASVEEMKGRNMEHLGKKYDILQVKNDQIKWNGLPFTWND